MTDSPLSVEFQAEERDSATIGIVEAVAPDRIDVALLQEAPHGTGLREGSFHRFPRINSYVVLPSERGSILAIVVWLGIDDEFAQRTSEPDRIGLPVPRRRLRALPLGVLRRSSSLLDGSQPSLEIDRGVLLFPTVGDPVRLPTREEAAAAVPSISDGRLTVPIGRAPLAGDAEIHVDPNRLYGRHLAVLGNTGSGKSCTVAQLLRSSAVAAGERATAFRTIVLDLNGEYGNAFGDLEESIPVRRFSVTPPEGVEQLRVPAWLWNYDEWLSFTDASAKSQAAQLRRALHLVRTTDLSLRSSGLVRLVGGRQTVRRYAGGAVSDVANANCLSALDNVARTCGLILEGDTSLEHVLDPLRRLLVDVLAERRGTRNDPWTFGARQLDLGECASLLPLFNDAIDAHGVPEFLEDGLTVDTPVVFDPLNLLELLPIVAADSSPDVAGWISPLVERLRVSLGDERLLSISGWKPNEDFGTWLTTYLSDRQENQVAVLDLSLVPSQILHLVTAVMARVLLEALERHRRQRPSELVPVVLVVEEAHSLIRRHVGPTNDDQAVPMARLCREAFERIAREGRKFGLSLVVSSQRPSELSETVLSQCNTFLIHRLVNDHDQNLVRRLVPDNLGGLVQELPALPSQTALLLGWAIDVPTLVRINDLEERHRPTSADPDFSAAWRGEGHGNADWSSVADEWASKQVNQADEADHVGDEDQADEDDQEGEHADDEDTDDPDEGVDE